MRYLSVNDHDLFEENWQKIYDKLPLKTRDVYERVLFEMIGRYLEYEILLDPSLTGGEDLSRKDYDDRDARLKKTKNDTLDKRARRAWNREDKETAIKTLEELVDLTKRIKHSKQQIKELLTNMREDSFEMIPGKGYPYAEEAKNIIKAL